MELLSLYLTFLKIGLFNFGGGYAMLPMIQREIVNKHHWATDDEVVDYFAVGQCTPGAIAVNVATFIGYKKKGIIGGIVATLGLVTPAFFIIFLIATLLTNFADNAYVSHALAGIRIMVFVLVLSAIIKLAKKSCRDVLSISLAVLVGIGAICIDVIPLYCYIIFAGIFGIIINVIKEKKKQNNIEAENNIEEVNDNAVIEEASSVEGNTPVEKEKHKALYFIIGLLVGILFSIAGFISFIFVKNKRYRNGVVATALFNLIMVVCTVISIFKHDTLLFKLYFQYAKIGLLAFGGGLATIPFLYELSEITGWFTTTDLANMIAVSESTPGAMGINMSTYVGYMTAQNAWGNYFLSFISSVISTLGIVTPAIVVIVIVSVFLKKFKDNKYVNYAFYGLRAASVGLIIAAAFSILKISILNEPAIHSSIFKDAFDVYKGVKLKTLFPRTGDFFDVLINWKALGIGAIFAVLVFKLKKHPIIYIIFAAFIGIVLQL